MVDCLGMVADGQIAGRSANYATARSTSVGAPYSGVTGVKYTVGQLWHSTTGYIIDRLFLKFDTATLGADADIAQLNLKLQVIDNMSNGSWDVVIKKQDWSAQEPLMTYREAAYDNALTADADDSIMLNTGTMGGTGSKTSGNLSTSWVNKTGFTYYSLLSSRDIAGITPIGFEYVNFAMSEHATPAYRPVLIVKLAVTGAVKILPAIGVVGLGSGGVRIRPTGGIRL